MKTKQFIKTLLLFFTFIEVTVSSPQLENVTINFANMSPHLNQNLFLRVIDKSTLKETSRTSHQITSANLVFLFRQSRLERVISLISFLIIIQMDYTILRRQIMPGD